MWRAHFHVGVAALGDPGGESDGARDGKKEKDEYKGAHDEEDQPSRNPLVDIRFLYLATQSIRVSDYNHDEDAVTILHNPRGTLSPRPV